jgi:phosphoribosylanthranilate isomerase
MNPTRVKICGITTVADATSAYSLGADFIGVIFAESPRRVDLERAAAIRAAVPLASLVGVFQDADIDTIAHAAAFARLDMIQLHGRESPEFVGTVIAHAGKPVIKVFNSNRVPAVDELTRYTRTSYFLLDTDKNVDVAETARLDDVARIRRLGFRVFLAGGLTPDNVRDSVAATQPFAVDVCRGVERSPGVKDTDAVARFIAEARR